MEIGSTHFPVGIIRHKSTRRSQKGGKWCDLRQRAMSGAGELCLIFFFLIAEAGGERRLIEQVVILLLQTYGEFSKLRKGSQRGRPLKITKWMISFHYF